ncbi:LCP family protein [Clostridium grantii]|uniref:Transcriptional attenuator, LytR family n=1 Tax=Clostridium grantii DSM 8605 TaxID=1121316 RepID=A0A1M5UWK5_9CLOT|nr:LCP family protein [Clostridium grantii]SHH67352.1 transcriptional attenuator, LytR family [Clostridium grantii DSM 8605]
MRKNRVITILILIFITSTGGYIFYQYKRINKIINKVEINHSSEILEINEETNKESKKLSIYNFVLFGLDRREKSEDARSDSIIIVTIDEKNNKIKLSSIMRDTYVSIKGHGKSKINHAYAYGGPELAIKTINKNFELNIQEYVAVNFWDVIEIVDLIGGVNVDIHEDEVKHVHGIDKVGNYNLNGSQALDYSRIRYAEGGDYVRTDRQRKILTTMYNKIMNLEDKDKYNLLSQITLNIETSMDNDFILKLASSVISNKITSIEEKRFPLEGEDKKIKGVYYLVTDIEEMNTDMKKFIFN